MSTASIHAYAVKAAKAELEPFEFQPGELGSDEVEVRVRFCGVCHSDLEMIDNGWGMSTYPLVPGHEAIGEVTAVGSAVLPREARVGDVVGVGWQAGSCNECRYCRRGRENFCVDQGAIVNTIVHHHGAFADRVRCQARWAVKIPADLDHAKAGPLMCAGTTVWSPIRHAGVEPGMRTAVVGVGGLGHLAVQFLAKMGTEVTAIGATHSKEGEARQLGATDFVATKGEQNELAHARGRFDFIISTVPTHVDWNALVQALAPAGQLAICGIPDKPLDLQAFPMIDGERVVRGGRAGSPSDTAEMLAFCAAHRVLPWCEQFPMKEINAAVRHVREGKARYRAVLAA